MVGYAYYGGSSVHSNGFGCITQLHSILYLTWWLSIALAWLHSRPDAALLWIRRQRHCLLNECRREHIHHIPVHFSRGAGGQSVSLDYKYLGISDKTSTLRAPANQAAPYWSRRITPNCVYGIRDHSATFSPICLLRWSLCDQNVVPVMSAKFTGGPLAVIDSLL